MLFNIGLYHVQVKVQVEEGLDTKRKCLTTSKG
jgi:hypothetical protein